MGSSRWIVRALILAGTGVALAFVVYQLRQQRQQADAAVQNIEDQLDSLDPATRAAVVARLTSDEVHRVRG